MLHLRGPFPSARDRGVEMDEARWRRRLEREKARCAELERLVEDKTRQLYLANAALRSQNELLEVQVAERTRDLQSALQAAEAAGHAKMEFLAQMSHELRTPLHGLGGTIEALSRTQLDGDQQRYVELCQSSNARLMRVIGDILDFSRIESKMLALEQEEVCIQDLVDSTVWSFAAAAEQKGLTLKCEVKADSRAWVRADSHRLGQVLSNLLANAVRFTESGSILVTVAVELDGDRAHVRWQVSDTGCGMTPSQAAKVFDPFQQAEAATTRRFGGAGLGLAIVKGILSAMGSEVELETSPGDGSTFRFATDHEICADPSVRERERDLQLDLGGRCVLVVDDHPINRAVCEAMLRRTGADLILAEDGSRALRVIESLRPDLVLMDCHMPGLSGLAVARRMRRAGVAAPILAVSADVSGGNRAAVQSAGMQGLLGKPFRQRDLFAAIAELLPVATKSAFVRQDALDLADQDEEMLAHLCQLFLEELPASVRQLRESIEDGNAPQARLRAHSLKGAAGVVGAKMLADVAADLEQQARQGACRPEFLEQIEVAVRATEAALREHLASKRAPAV